MAMSTLSIMYEPVRVADCRQMILDRASNKGNMISPLRILLVDDSATTRSLIKVYLMGRSYEFVEAKHGANALALLRDEVVNLIITDMNMPEMDGLAFIKRIRSNENRQLRAIPVIMLTGERDSAVLREKAVAAGASGFVKKPVTSSDLCGVIDQLNLVTKGAP